LKKHGGDKQRERTFTGGYYLRRGACPKIAFNTLFGKSELAPRSYAEIEIEDAGAISLGVHNWNGGRPIPASYFPASIPPQR